MSLEQQKSMPVQTTEDLPIGGACPGTDTIHSHISSNVSSNGMLVSKLEQDFHNAHFPDAEMELNSFSDSPFDQTGAAGDPEVS